MLYIWQMGLGEIIEHKNGSYNVQKSKVNIGNGILQACPTRSHFKSVKAPLFSCTTGIIAFKVHLMFVISQSALKAVI